ncbi:hypothetical protein [Paraglaciecola arctica]|nr:hypothetical protein [Paraglaciecola arctica]
MAQHKQAVINLIETQLSAEDKTKAEQIGLLVEGAIVMAHTRGAKHSALIAKEMAQNLISVVF